jgi:GNAT superfamily N-acetyltransferase
MKLVESESDPATQFLQHWAAIAPALDSRVEVVFKPVSEFRVELAGIAVSQNRNQGLGSAVMNQITELADQTGTIVVLYPEPSAMIRLVRYYERFGFITMDGGNSMEYEPVG